MQLKYWALNLVESFVFIFVFYVAENNFYDLAMALLHDSLRLHITNEAFYIETLNARVHDVLVIDRINREISVHEHREDIPPSLAESKVKTILFVDIYFCIAHPSLTLSVNLWSFWSYSFSEWSSSYCYY